MNLYKERRQKFADLMSSNSAALFLGAKSQHRNNDVEYRFRQDSSFWYLTGFNEPEATLLLLKTKQEFKSFIFVRPREKEKEIWTGRRAGTDQAKEITQVCEAFEIKQLEEELEKKLLGLEQFYFDYGNHQAKRILEIAKSKRIQKLMSTQNLIGELRLFKDENEIKQMKEAAQITVQAHKIALQAAKEGIPEYFIEAKLESYFRECGANWAYPSIVASGANATILHYIENNKILQKGELLLIDAGCEKNYYAADLTRTFPINSKFSTPQKEIYELVLNSQKAAIQQAKTKNATFDSVHEATVKVLAQGLIDLKLLKGGLAEVLEQKTYRKFYMHRTGHWLGLDVHDLGSYLESNGNSRILKPGMIMTVEPGLYLDSEDTELPKDFRGIGVRIEDDILFTQNGLENLTENMPKGLEELEAIIEC